MENTELSYVFDMKGSRINREELKDLSYDQLKKKPPTGGKVLKDLDYIRLKEIFRFLKLSPSNISYIMRNLTVDVNFLRSQRFMDYSLLFAIRKVDKLKNNQHLPDDVWATLFQKVS